MGKDPTLIRRLQTRGDLLPNVELIHHLVPGSVVQQLLCEIPDLFFNRAHRPPPVRANSIPRRDVRAYSHRRGRLSPRSLDALGLDALGARGFSPRGAGAGRPTS